MQRVDESSWRPPSAAQSWAVGGIVTTCVLRGRLSLIEADDGLLSDDERERATRLALPERRRDFVAGRSFLRRTLASALGIEPAEIAFRYGPLGKPELAGGGDLVFNLAHSGDLILLALGPSGELGVDVELPQPGREVESLARRFFAPEERAALLELEGERRALAFHRIWTRKEAVLKLLGSGVFEGLDSFSVSAGERPEILCGSEAMTGIELVELELGGALATLGHRAAAVPIEAFDHSSYESRA